MESGEVEHAAAVLAREHGAFFVPERGGDLRETPRAQLVDHGNDGAVEGARDALVAVEQLRLDPAADLLAGFAELFHAVEAESHRFEFGRRFLVFHLADHLVEILEGDEEFGSFLNRLST